MIAATSGWWAMMGLASIFLSGAAVMFFGYLALHMDDRREERGYRGGYHGGNKPTSEYRRPPDGPAPGGKR